MKTIILLALTFLTSSQVVCQEINFKLIQAIKSTELIHENRSGSSLFKKIDVLPEGKKYLIVIAEAENLNTTKIKIKKDELTLKSGNEIAGYLTYTKKANLGWPSSLRELKKGKNYFSAIFIVESELNKTEINIKNQKFEISKISDTPHSSLICIPEITLSEKKYSKKISYEEQYFRLKNQVVTRENIPNSGQFLAVKTNVIFCDDAQYFKEKVYAFHPKQFQIEDGNGTVFECIGTLNQFDGKFSNPSLVSIQPNSKRTQIEISRILVFNVPKEGNYKLRYLDQVVSEI